MQLSTGKLLSQAQKTQWLLADARSAAAWRGDESRYIRLERLAKSAQRRVVRRYLAKQAAI